jgi:chromosome partitioning protein
MILSITNLKGGVGKSTIAQNIAVCLRQKGHSVFLVDTDFELKTTMDWGNDRGADLVKIDVECVHQDNVTERVLEVADKYDVVIIDGTPALFELSSKAILLSDAVFIPIIPSIEEVRTLERFMKRYKEAKMMKKRIGGDVEAHIILNKYNQNLRIDREVEDILQEFELPVLKSKIAYRVAYREAKIEGKGVVEYDDKKAKEEMQKLADEVSAIIEKYL